MRKISICRSCIFGAGICACVFVCVCVYIIPSPCIVCHIRQRPNPYIISIRIPSPLSVISPLNSWRLLVLLLLLLAAEEYEEKEWSVLLSAPYFTTSTSLTHYLSSQLAPVTSIPLPRTIAYASISPLSLLPFAKPSAVAVLFFAPFHSSICGSSTSITFHRLALGPLRFLPRNA